jgi:hypothetical protein
MRRHNPKYEDSYMPDPKFNPNDEVPVEDLEQASGAGIPVTPQQAGERPGQRDSQRDSDRAPELGPDPWKNKPT